MIIFTPNTVIRSTEINANFDELKVKTDYLTAPSASWQTATLESSWVRYHADFYTAQYYKDAVGIVHLRGMVKNGAGATIFTLPTGYRMGTDGTAHGLFNAQGSSGLGRIDIYPAGAVNYIAGGTSWLSLDGISFRAEQ